MWNCDMVHIFTLCVTFSLLYMMMREYACICVPTMKCRLKLHTSREKWRKSHSKKARMGCPWISSSPRMASNLCMICRFFTHEKKKWKSKGTIVFDAFNNIFDVYEQSTRELLMSNDWVCKWRFWHAQILSNYSHTHTYIRMIHTYIHTYVSSPHTSS